MDAIKFTELVNNPSEIHQHDVVELKRLAHQYPYSQIVQLMYAMRLKDSSEHLFNQQLGRTSILTSDRTILYDLFEDQENQIKNIASVEASSAQVKKENSAVETIEAKQTLKEEKEAVVEKLEVKEEIRKKEIKAVAKVEDEIEAKLKPLFKEAPKPLESVEEEVDLSLLSPAERIKAILKRSRKIQEEFEANKKGGVGATNERVKAIRDRLEEIKRKNPSIGKNEDTQAEEKIDKEQSKIALPEEEKTILVSEEITAVVETEEEFKPEKEVSDESSEIEVPKEETPPILEETIESVDERADVQPEAVSIEESETFKESEEDSSKTENLILEEEDKGIDNENTASVVEEIAKTENGIEEDKEVVIPIFTIDDEAEEKEEEIAPIGEDEVHVFVDWFKRLSSLTKEAKDKSKEEEKIGFKQKIELFDTFVEKLPKIKKKNLQEVVLPKAAKQESINVEVDGGSLVTETLAKVYIKQGHFDKAMKAYQILKLKYPEKSGFFADRISEIKKLKNNK